jgi:beta-galactosidase
VFCYIAAVDDNGTINTDYSEEINVTLKGDLEMMNPDVIKAEAGIATALIRVGKSLNGSLSVKAKDLKSDKFSF